VFFVCSAVPICSHSRCRNCPLLVVSPREQRHRTALSDCVGERLRSGVNSRDAGRQATPRFSASRFHGPLHRLKVTARGAPCMQPATLRPSICRFHRRRTTDLVIAAASTTAIKTFRSRVRYQRMLCTNVKLSSGCSQSVTLLT